MRSSAVLAVAILAASPAFSAPSGPFYSARRSGSGGSFSSTPSSGGKDASGAIDLASIGNFTTAAIPIIEEIIDHFKNKNQGSTASTVSTPPPVDTSVNATDASANTTVSARSIADSGALDFAAIGNLTTAALPIIDKIIDHFKNKNKNSATPVVATPPVPVASAVAARSDDDSGALDLATIGNITSAALPLIEQLIQEFTNKATPPSTREVIDLFARVDPEEIEDVEKVAKFTLDDAKNIASIGSSVVSVVHNIFSGHKDSSQPSSRQDLIEEILARTDVDESGAFSLKSLGDIGSVALTAASLLGDIFRRHEGVDHVHSRELLEALLARDVSTDQSGAFSLKSLGNIGSVALTAASLLGDLFRRYDSMDHAERREFVELLTREDTSDSEALSLSGLGSLFSFGTSIIGGLINSFTGKQSRRSLDESGALELLLGPNGLLTNRPTRPGGIVEPGVAHVVRSYSDDLAALLQVLNSKAAPKQKARQSLNDLD